jgi:hypothetical protein
MRFWGSRGLPEALLGGGGPGLPAASTHFEGFGPKRIAGSRLVDNADTLSTASGLRVLARNATGDTQ